MTGGSSMLAMTLTVPLQLGQVSTSIRKTRLSLCAQRIAACCAAGVRFSSRAILTDRALAPRPRRAGVIRAGYGLLGANTPWKRVNFKRSGEPVQPARR